MHDAVFMGEVNSAGKGFREGGGLCGRQGRAGQEFVEAAAAYVLQRQERPALKCADFVDLDDIRMLEAGDRLGLGPETLQDLGIWNDGRAHLQSHQPVQLPMPGPIYDPHAAVADFPQHLVARHRGQAVVHDRVGACADGLGVGRAGGATVAGLVPNGLDDLRQVRKPVGVIAAAGCFAPAAAILQFKVKQLFEENAALRIERSGPVGFQGRSFTGFPGVFEACADEVHSLACRRRQLIDVEARSIVHCRLRCTAGLRRALPLLSRQIEPEPAMAMARISMAAKTPPRGRG